MTLAPTTHRAAAWRAAIPNSLTVSRLLLAVALPWIPADYQFATLLFAGLTDLVDGWLSRWLGVTSGFGQIVDPIADKTLVLVSLCVALSRGWIHPGELLGMAARDLTALGWSARALWLRWENWKRLTPRWSGKVATAGQIAALLAVFWTQQPCPFWVWLAIVLSVISAIDYSLQAWTAPVIGIRCT
jgi:cardiolipin synthase (CMP-forming)